MFVFFVCAYNLILKTFFYASSPTKQQQLIVSLAIGAVIDAVGSTIIITFISSAFMLCAAGSAMAILYMEL